MKLTKLILVGAIFLTTISFANAQSLINGNFENGPSACIINAPNSMFNSNMLNVNGFGIGDNLDIVDSFCSYGLAQNGDYYVGIATNDAFSFDLTSPVISGISYEISFYGRRIPLAVAPDLDIGLNNINSSSGTIVGTILATTIDTVWTFLTLNFVAPANANYITITGVGGIGTWIDNFSLSVITELKESLSEYQEIQIYPNPTSGQLSISLGKAKTGVLRLLNSLGQLVFEDTFEATKELNISLDGPSGLYFLQVEIDGELITKKVVKE